MSRCPTDDALERLALGRGPWWRAWLWRWHLAGCPACRGRAAGLLADEAFLRELRGLFAGPRPGGGQGPMSTSLDRIRRRD